ncbi:MAG: DNA polymerase IV [Bacteroidota bacterium]
MSQQTANGPNYVLHLDLDTFFISVERLMNPRLKDRPVMVGGSGDRGVVAACSYEARTFGVHSAMPMKQARILCPEAIIIRGDMDAYVRKSKEVTDVIHDKAPVYEKASIDEHYLDLTGMGRFRDMHAWASDLRLHIISETGLPVSGGLSLNKSLSKIAGREAKPSNLRIVEAAEVRAFLDALPVQRIPGIGQKMQEGLKEMGITRIKHLAEMPREYMLRAMGKAGLSAWEKANGIDDSPVVSVREAKSVSREQTFKADTIDTKMIREVLVDMAEQLGFELRQTGHLAGCLSIKIRYANFDTHTKDLSLPYTAADHVLIENAGHLFTKVYERRMMIRLIGLKVTKLVPGGHQVRLFEESEKLMHLYERLDCMRLKFGNGAVMRAAAMPSRTAEVPQLPDFHLGMANIIARNA